MLDDLNRYLSKSWRGFTSPRIGNIRMVMFGIFSIIECIGLRNHVKRCYRDVNALVVVEANLYPTLLYDYIDPDLDLGEESICLLDYTTNSKVLRSVG